MPVIFRRTAEEFHNEDSQRWREYDQILLINYLDQKTACISRSRVRGHPTSEEAETDAIEIPAATLFPCLSRHRVMYLGKESIPRWGLSDQR